MFSVLQNEHSADEVLGTRKFMLKQTNRRLKVTAYQSKVKIQEMEPKYLASLNNP